MAYSLLSRKIEKIENSFGAFKIRLGIFWSLPALLLSCWLVLAACEPQADTDFQLPSNEIDGTRGSMSTQEVSHTLVASQAPTLTRAPSNTPTPSPTETPSPSPTLDIPSSIEFEIENGVDPDNINAIKVGVESAHQYLVSSMGGDEAAEKGILVSIFDKTSDESCCLGLTEDSSGNFVAGPRFYTLHPEWRRGNSLFPGSIDLEHAKHSAHEYSHAWQASVGCLGSPYGQILGSWLTEGMAEYIAWNSLVNSGFVTKDQATNFHMGTIISSGEDPDFRSWENPDNTFDWWAYSYSYFAVDMLASDYSGDLTLRNICEEAARVAPVTNLRDYLNLPIALDNVGIDRDVLYRDLNEYFEEVVN